MPEWSFLTHHARVLLCIAHDPGARLRDIAASLNITERTAFGIVTDLADAGYVIKDKQGRRNSYQIRENLPVPDPIPHGRTIGQLLDLLVDTDTRRPPLKSATTVSRKAAVTVTAKTATNGKVTAKTAAKSTASRKSGAGATQADGVTASQNRRKTAANTPRARGSSKG
jgi:hypothetical protein